MKYVPQLKSRIKALTEEEPTVENMIRIIRLYVARGVVEDSAKTAMLFVADLMATDALFIANEKELEEWLAEQIDNMGMTFDELFEAIEYDVELSSTTWV